METVIKGFMVLITNLNLKFLSLPKFNCEGRNLEFPGEKLKSAHTQDIGVFGHNFIGRKKWNFIKMQVETVEKPKFRNLSF
jgi:hypothetical protein